jgi:GNAT superfamily N-acetyltransferase
MVKLSRTSDEFGRLRELLAEYEDNLPADLRHSDPTGSVQSLEIRYGYPNGAFLAYVDSEPAGCVVLRAFDESTAIVQRLYVKPEYRGHGIARLLLDSLFAFSRDRLYKRLVLDTDRERLSQAYDLYRSLGFTECEPYGQVDYENPTYMELRLH